MDSVSLFGLVGFFVGIVLHLFLLSVVLKRLKRKSFERLLISLLTGLLLWYSGNFISFLLRQLNPSKVELLLAFTDTAAFLGLAFLPALLLHTHWVYFRNRFDLKPAERSVLQTVVVVMYAQLLLLPVALPSLFTNTGIHPLQKLGQFQTPFLALLATSYYISCYLQIRLIRLSGNDVERALFKRLTFWFLAIPVYNFWVFGLGSIIRPPEHQLWVLIALLASLFPTMLVAYYIYRHQFLQITVHRSLASAFLILLITIIYLAGIRRIGVYLERELDAPPLLLEGTFLITILLLFPPISEYFRRWVSRSFTKELEYYQQLADSVGRVSPSIISVTDLKQYLEDVLKEKLPVEDAKIYLDREQHYDPSTTVFPLRSGDKRIGFLEVSPREHDQHLNWREGTRILANEISATLERTELLDRQLQMERELTQRTHLEQLGRMAATIAHNVKNPLSSINTLMQLHLEADNLTDDQKHEIDMVLQEIGRLSKTVSTLLHFSRLGDQTRKDLQEKEIRVGHLFESLGTLFRGSLEEGGISLQFSGDQECQMIRTDPDCLRDILSNLLSNAVEASPRGTTIRLSATRKNHQIEFSVEDEGSGIPKRIQKKLVAPFFTTKSRGTGLGLAIVKRRVEVLGGELLIQSPIKESGTRISVVIPEQLTTRVGS